MCVCERERERERERVRDRDREREREREREEYCKLISVVIGRINVNYILGSRPFQPSHCVSLKAEGRLHIKLNIY